jgi:hypothetical protein
MKETDFAKKITKNLRNCNALVLSVVGNRMQQNSWPDIYVAHKYWIGWIEFKGEKTKLRKDQAMLLEELWKRGVEAYVVRCPNLIESYTGNSLETFCPNTPVELLKVLREM